MNFIEEKITVHASVENVWKAWSYNYLESGFEIGKKNYTEKNKGFKFKIQDYKENESLTVVWYSFLIKLVFSHYVEKKDFGSLITCRVAVKGFFSFLIRPIIANNIRKYLKISLNNFAQSFKNS